MVYVPLQIVCISFGFWSLSYIPGGHSKEVLTSNASNYSELARCVKRAATKNGSIAQALSEKDLESGGIHRFLTETEIRIPSGQTLSEKDAESGGIHHIPSGQMFDRSPCDSSCLVYCWLVVIFVTFPMLAFAVVFHNMWRLLRGAIYKDTTQAGLLGAAGHERGHYSMHRVRVRRSTFI